MQHRWRYSFSCSCLATCVSNVNYRAKNNSKIKAQFWLKHYIILIYNGCLMEHVVCVVQMTCWKLNWKTKKKQTESYGHFLVCPIRAHWYHWYFDTLVSPSCSRTSKRWIPTIWKVAWMIQSLKSIQKASVNIQMTCLFR